MAIEFELDREVARAFYEVLAPHFRKQPDLSQVVKVPGQGDWSRDMIEQLRPEVQPYRGAVALLDLVASRPDQEVRYFELTGSTGLADMQVRADLGAMTKASRKLFGRRTWPLRAWQASDGIMTYVMPETIAKWWLGK